MRYYGGKGIHGKKISKIILNHIHNKNIDLKNSIYIEPFCGALGVLRHIAPMCKKVYANDISKDLIMLWNCVKNNKFKNPNINEKKWRLLKESKKSSPEKAFAGFGCSFGGVWFNGYIADHNNNNMQYNSLIKQIDNIKNVTFTNKNYIDFINLILQQSRLQQSRLQQSRLTNHKNDINHIIIYMDPPYNNTNSDPWQDQNINKFDSVIFWKIVKELKKFPNITVIISEFNAPKFMKTLYKFERRSGMHNTNNKSTYIEKLYI